MAFVDALKQLATVQCSDAGKTNSYGTKGEVWNEVATGVKCRVSFGLSAKTRHSVGDFQSIKIPATVYMQYRTDVKEHMRLLIDNEVYIVHLVIDPGARHHHLQLITELVRA